MSQVTPEDAEEHPPKPLSDAETLGRLSTFIDLNRSLITAISLFTTLAGVSTILPGGDYVTWFSLFAFALSFVLSLELVGNGWRFFRRPEEPFSSVAVFLSLLGGLIYMLVLLALERHGRLVAQSVITGTVFTVCINVYEALTRIGGASRLKSMALGSYVVFALVQVAVIFVVSGQVLGIH